MGDLLGPPSLSRVVPQIDSRREAERERERQGESRDLKISNSVVEIRIQRVRS